MDIEHSRKKKTTDTTNSEAGGWVALWESTDTTKSGANTTRTSKMRTPIVISTSKKPPQEKIGYTIDNDTYVALKLLKNCFRIADIRMLWKNCSRVLEILEKCRRIAPDGAHV